MYIILILIINMLIGKITKLYSIFPKKRSFNYNYNIYKMHDQKNKKFTIQLPIQSQKNSINSIQKQMIQQQTQFQSKLYQYPGLEIAFINQTKKRLDLDISNMYKQILQKQRVRMQSNQRRVQQLLNKEKARSDRKQQQIRDQIKQFLQSLRAMIGIGGILGLIYYFFTIVNQGGQAIQKIRKYWQQWSSQYELIQKYSRQELKLPKYYLNHNSIQKQLAKIEFDQIIGLSYIIGTPGTGKTTALKQVVNKLRKKIKDKENSRWQKLYYINLRVDDQNGKILHQKTRQRIQQMSKLLKSIFQHPDRYQKALIIIDDIQMFQKVLNQQQAKQKLQSILFKCQMESCKFVVVSSSSFSCYQALQNVNFRKSAYISQVQNLTQEQLKKVIENRIKYQRQVNQLVIPDSVIKYIYGYDSIRAIMQSISLVANQYRMNKLTQIELSQQTLLQKLKDYDQNRIWQMKLQIIKMLRQKSQILGAKEVAYIIETILKLNKHLRLGHKFEIIDKVVKKFPRLRNKLDEISNVIDELDKKNLLIFGHPRSKLQRQALRQVLDGLCV